MANNFKDQECCIYNLWDIVIVTGAGRNNKLAALTRVWKENPLSNTCQTRFYIAPLEKVVEYAVEDEKLSHIEYKLPRYLFNQYEVEQRIFDMITKR